MDEDGKIGVAGRDTMALEMAELRALIVRLQAQVDDLRAGMAAATPPAATAEQLRNEPPVDGHRPPPAELSVATSRRQLMTKGAAVAAGAALAGTAAAVATAAPAVAAAGSFDGNPAVTGVANPSSGVGVRGSTVTGVGVDGSSGSGSGTGVRGTANTGIGVYGLSVATTGTGSGVRADGYSPDGFAVDAENFRTDGDAIAVRATTGSPDGRALFAQSGSGAGQGKGVVGLSKSNGGTGVQGLASSASGPAPGVHGQVASPSGIGVIGENTAVSGGGTGVQGLVSGDGAIGVVGRNDASTGQTAGVQGVAESPGGFGVIGVGEGFGVGASGKVAVLAQSPNSQLALTGDPVAPLTAGAFRTKGEVVFDEHQDLWLCVADGTPGTWRRLGGPATAGAFVPLNAPVRAYDSRPPFPPATGPKTKLTPNVARAVDCTLNGTGVPTTATGVLVSLIAANPDAEGFMAIYRNGVPWPGTSNLNFPANQVVAVTTYAATAAGKVAVYANVATHVVLDILGFYQ